MHILTFFAILWIQCCRPMRLWEAWFKCNGWLARKVIQYTYIECISFTIFPSTFYASLLKSSRTRTMNKIYTVFTFLLVACATLINTGVTQCTMANLPDQNNAFQMCKLHSLRHLRPDLETVALRAPTSTNITTFFVTQTRPGGNMTNYYYLLCVCRFARFIEPQSET